MMAGVEEDQADDGQLSQRAVGGDARVLAHHQLPLELARQATPHHPARVALLQDVLSLTGCPAAQLGALAQ